MSGEGWTESRAQLTIVYWIRMSNWPSPRLFDVIEYFFGVHTKYSITLSNQKPENLRLILICNNFSTATERVRDPAWAIYISYLIMSRGLCAMDCIILTKVLREKMQCAVSMFRDSKMLENINTECVAIMKWDICHRIFPHKKRPSQNISINSVKNRTVVTHRHWVWKV